MSAKIISQRRFAKLVATTSPLAQPPGAVTRASNLLFTTRGSLQIADGSVDIANKLSGDILSLAAFNNNVPGSFPYYLALTISTTPSLTDVTGFDFTTDTGTLNPIGFYTFGIVALLGTGHTDINNSFLEKGIVAPFDNVMFTWTPVAGATGYQIWVYASSAFEGTLLATVAGGGSSSYTYSGVVPAPGTTPAPIGNTTLSLQLYSSTPGVPLLLVIVTAGKFPAISVQPVTLAPGSPQFNPSPIVPGYSPYGGLASVTCPIPTIIQFAGQSILILGNGLAPQEYDPTTGVSGSVTALTNTFTAAYPTWQANVSWITGAQVTDGAGNFFTATQGGVSGATTPTWSTPQGTETPDGSIIWTSNGPIPTPVAPRGAAHAVAYAGSLWLANTSPTTTSDSLDGPTCIKMSDSNNPNSWNPVNIAFIGRNDGTQITGMQPFTIAALGISPTGSLCVFKEFTTYQVIGVFGSTAFEIQPAQTNLGCIAARSIQFIPGFGVCRFSHLGFAVFDGINDRLISEDIRAYLFGGVDSESDLVPIDPSFVYRSAAAQTVSPPMYLCAMPLALNQSGATGTGAMTRLFCYDLVMKSWTVLDLPWAIDTLASLSVGEGYPIVLAGKFDGTIQRLQAGDVNWDRGDGAQSSVNWSFRSPDVFGEGSSQRLFFEMVTIRGYGSAAMVASIIANLWMDGQQIGAQAIDIVPQGGSNLFEARVKIFRSGYRVHLDVSGNNGNAPGTIDALDWAVSPKSSLARRIIG